MARLDFPSGWTARAVPAFVAIVATIVALAVGGPAAGWVAFAGIPIFAVALVLSRRPDNGSVRSALRPGLRPGDRAGAHPATTELTTGCLHRDAFLRTVERATRQAQATASSMTVGLVQLERSLDITSSEHVEVVRALANALPPGAHLGRLRSDELGVIAAGVSVDELTSHLERTITRTVGSKRARVRLMNVTGAEVAVDVLRSLVADVSAERVPASDSNGVGAPPLSADGTAHDSSDTRAIRTSDGASVAFIARLARAIERGAIDVHYQPLVSLETGRPRGFEALVRWHDRGALLAPGSFLPQAEAADLMGDLTRFVLRRALVDVASLQSLTRVGVSVNVPASVLCADGFVDDVVGAVVASGIGADQVTLELTEAEAVHDATSVSAVLSRLRSLGVRLSIDDFGTGYAPLTHVSTFPVHEVKIDSTFVRGLPESEADAAVVRSIVELARHLDLEIVAEGIETVQQAAWLTACGCDVGQGFLYSRALPIDEVGAWLLDRRRLAFVV